MWLLLIVIILILIFGFPAAPYMPQGNVRYAPYGGLITLILVLVILRIMGVI